MPSCVFRRCKNYTATVRERNISFHLIPRKGVLREKWLKIIRTERREDDWIANTYSTVCSEHFLSQDFYLTKKNILRLKKTAVPVLKQEETRQQATSPTSLEEVELSDEEQIFDSPQTAYLKSKIKKLSLDKRELQSKNSNLTRKYKRLQKTCILLKRIVLKLRNKLSEDQMNELSVIPGVE